MFFLYASLGHLALPSFPTRRSSDLAAAHGRSPFIRPGGRRIASGANAPEQHAGTKSGSADRGSAALARRAERSEEHTSELQSTCNLVCRLLLEKKHKNSTTDSS